MADQTVSMISPDGKDVADVPADQVEHFKTLGAKVVEAPPPQVDRGGLTHPLTSLLNPELEGVRAKLNTSMATPHGQPFMARSRTGTLYPSETGTGGVDIAKTAARTVGGFALDNAEGLTSPAGIATMGAAKGVSAMTRSPTAINTIGRGLQFVGDYGSIKTPVGKIGDALVNAVEDARMNPPRTMAQVYSEKPAPPPPAPIPPPPHLNLSQPMPAGQLTQDQIGERIAAVQQQGGLPPQPPVTPKAPLVSAGDKALLARQGYSPEMLPPSPAPRVPAPLPVSPPMGSSQLLPLYPSAGTVKGVTSNALETASNVALAAGHWDEAERLIGQSLQSFFQGSGGPMVGVMAAAIAHKARQVVEPLRADPAFQRAAPAKQQQMIQQALRQPGARGSLTNALGS